MRGLTTAASLWEVACLGLAAGGGFYEAAIAGTVAIILTLTIFEYLEKKFRKVKHKELQVEMDCTDLSATLISLKKIAPSYDMLLGDVDVSETIGEDKVLYHLVSKLSFCKSSKKINSESFLSVAGGVGASGHLHVRLDAII